MTKPVYDTSKPDQPRLKAARAEIEAILKKHDLAGVIVLHTPGMSEFFYDVSPSYSCTWIDEQAGAVRVRSKLADYGGDAAAQLHDLSATANMAAALFDGLRAAAGMFGLMTRTVDKATNAEHTPGLFTPAAGEAKPS